MLLIKRYPNRKLYDTAARQYISLDNIADRVRDGVTVQVLEYATGEDITAPVLAQIIMEQEKRHSGYLPLALLNGMVQAGGHTLAALRRALSAPLDLVQHVDEEIQARVAQLISRGELAAEEGERLLRGLLARDASADAAPTAAQLAEAMLARGLPTRADIALLATQLADLEGEIDALLLAERGYAPPAEPS